jgi:hypothetical protein
MFAKRKTEVFFLANSLACETVTGEIKSPFAGPLEEAQINLFR